MAAAATQIGYIALVTSPVEWHGRRWNNSCEVSLSNCTLYNSLHQYRYCRIPQKARVESLCSHVQYSNRFDFVLWSGSELPITGTNRSAFYFVLFFYFIFFCVFYHLKRQFNWTIPLVAIPLYVMSCDSVTQVYTEFWLHYCIDKYYLMKKKKKKHFKYIYRANQIKQNRSKVNVAIASAWRMICDRDLAVTPRGCEKRGFWVEWGHARGVGSTSSKADGWV